jgi:hypothetical protein
MAARRRKCVVLWVLSKIHDGARILVIKTRIFQERNDMKTESVKRFAMISGLLLAGSAQASWYPPGYEVETSCQENGPVRICAVNQHYGSYPRLHITYFGYLLEKEWGKLSVWVKLNGRSGTFNLTNINFTEQVWLNRPKPYLCYVNGDGGGGEQNGDGRYKNCKRTFEPEGGLVWEVEPVPAAEADLFFYARTPDGGGNVWDIELAFSSRNGAWDSLMGQNYTFRFE